MKKSVPLLALRSALLLALLAPLLAGCLHHKDDPVFHGPPVVRPAYETGDVFLYMTRTKDLTGNRPDRGEYTAEILDGFEDFNGTKAERWMIYSEEWGLMNNGTVRKRGDTEIEWRRASDGAALSTYAGSIWVDNPGQANERIIPRWTVNEYFDGPCLRLQDLLPHALDEEFVLSCDSTIVRTQETPGEGPPAGSERSHYTKRIEVRGIDIVESDVGTVEAFRVVDDKDPEHAPGVRWYAPARCADVAKQVRTGTTEVNRGLLYVSRCDMGGQIYASGQVPSNFPFNPFKLGLREDTSRK